MKAMVTSAAFLLTLLIAVSYSQDEWVVQPSGTNYQLNSIGSWYDSTIWAVGNNGTILHTSNFGANWVQQPSGTTNDLFGITPDYFSYNIAVGENGTILKSSNNGANWLTLNSGVNYTLRSATLPSLIRNFVVGDNSVILKTTNAGANWILLQSPVSANFSDIISYGVMIVIGSNGTILKSTNVGNTWTLIPSGTTYNLNKLMNNAEGVWWIAGDHGTILKSTNEGSNWIADNSGTTMNLLSISVPDTMVGWVSGANGKILRTTNGGISWIDDLFGYNNTINDILFYNANYGYAIGTNGLILHTEYNLITPNALRLHANTISTWYTNLGSFNRDPAFNNAGFEWPKGSGKKARYASGPWLGAIVGNDTLVTVIEYSYYECLPGYTDNFGTPHGKDDPAYKVYKLTYGMNDSYRQQWPNALLGNSNQGAPVYFDFLTYSWKPLDYADQTMFYSYTDSYPEAHTNRAGSTSPLKADIKQINFAFDEPGALGNIQYCQFTLINRNNLPWVNVYFTIWSDDDVGEANDDKVGCDTSLDMGYTYNGVPVDPLYGNVPSAVSMNIIKGPAVYTGNNNDTAFICNGKSKKIKVGYKQIGMSAFDWYGSGNPINGDPRIYYETYRMLEGLTRDGVLNLNPVTNQLTKFMFSGDPVTGTGWIQFSANDQRFLMSMGPFNMNPGDTQIIVVAQVIARGSSNLNSISVLRQYAQIAKENYYNCFANVPIGIENLSNEIPTKFSLEQNFPNPFNPVTKIRFSIPLNKGGLRGLSVKLTIYDILGREFECLINQEMKPGKYEVDWDGTNFASGVYFYKLMVGDFTDVKKMVLIK